MTKIPKFNSKIKTQLNIQNETKKRSTLIEKNGQFDVLKQLQNILTND